MSIGLSGFAINIPFCLYQLTTFFAKFIILAGLPQWLKPSISKTSVGNRQKRMCLVVHI